MKNSSTAYLTQALGRLPDGRKAAFIKDALRTLVKFQPARPEKRPKLPKVDRIALTRVARQTARLIDAINGAQETETATMLLRDAWLNLDRITGETVGSPMPTLERLQQAAEFCLPRKKRAQSPPEKSPASSMAIATLADQFRQHFGKPPALGGASAFVRFLRNALPAYGLHVPSDVEIKKLAGRA
jgi:hypothetical protein